MRRRLTGIGAWALRLNWLLGISALMVTTGLGFSAAKASDRRCSCHQQGGEFGVRDTASEQTLGASVTSVIAAFAAGLALSACATAGTTVTQSGEAANGTPVPGHCRRDLTVTAQSGWGQISMGQVSHRRVGGNGQLLCDGRRPESLCRLQRPSGLYRGSHLTGGHVSGAVIGLIAGGKDVTIVNEMGAKYGLDPKSAS